MPTHDCVLHPTHFSLHRVSERERKRERVFFSEPDFAKIFFQMKYWKIWKYKEKIKSKKKMGSEGNSTKNIVVLGSEGVGKSSLCIRFF